MLGHPGAFLTPEGLLLPGLANIPFRDSNLLFICKPTDPEPVTPATFTVGLSHSGPLFTHPNHQKARFSSSAQSCLTLQPYELQHARPPGPSPTPRACSNLCPSNRWCHPTISSSVIPFSSCPQSSPASGSFQMSQLFASGGQSNGVSASTSILPMNTQDWSPLGWTGWICLQSKSLLQHHSSKASGLRCSAFFTVQLSSLRDYWQNCSLD